MIQTKAIKSTTNCNEYPKKVVALGMKPTHISVDFTQKLLGVVCCPKPDGLLYLYDIASFANKVKLFDLFNIVNNIINIQIPI